MQDIPIFMRVIYVVALIVLALDIFVWRAFA
jgi:hypothetical protein